MPGILPMKVIKIGSSSQTRIAQACDRCRSKKIRCDGVRPCCSQCAAVGFECKTSDKLSRRAFPRGYTESLEERVRALEAESRDLKDLLDAKDEQIDMLGRIHAYSPSNHAPWASTEVNQKSPPKRNSDLGPPQDLDDLFTMAEPGSLVRGNGREGAFFVGASSGRLFIDSFKRKVQDSGKACPNFSSESFFTSRYKSHSRHFSQGMSQQAVSPPPRLVSDHLVTSFFQEYHPLFPVIHRPTYLNHYKNLISGPESSNFPKDHHVIAQLFLIFSIALLQADIRTEDHQKQFDRQWQSSLDAIIRLPSIETVQCLVLAQLYCFARQEYAQLMWYRSVCVGIAQRIGLHQNQKHFNLGPLASETRRRVFWCLYTLDSFAASSLGLPRLINDSYVQADYPSDIDDEYVTEREYLPSLPGDHTKISSALALFRGARILSSVLDEVYASSRGEKQSYKSLKVLEDKLDKWKTGLAPHLRIEFLNGSLATNIVHSRSPFLVLAYHYIRMLVHRPAVGACTPSKSSASLHIVGESAKNTVQILRLLEERKLGFAFCLNKTQLLLMSGLSILYGVLDYAKDGALFKDCQRLTRDTIDSLRKAGDQIPQVDLFSSISRTLLRLDQRILDPSARTPGSQLQHPSHRPQQNVGIPKISPLSTANIIAANDASKYRKRLSNLASLTFGRPRSGTDSLSVDAMRRYSSSVHDLSASLSHQNSSRLSLDSSPSPPPPRRMNSSASVHLKQQSHKRPSVTPGEFAHESSAMDMFGWNFEPIGQDFLSSHPPPGSISSVSTRESTDGESPQSDMVPDSDWERMLAGLDAAHAGNIYGGSGHTGGGDPHEPELSTNAAEAILRSEPAHELSPEAWNVGTSDLQAGNWNIHSALHPTAASVSSFSTLSDDGFNSEENAAGSRHGSTSGNPMSLVKDESAIVIANGSSIESLDSYTTAMSYGFDDWGPV